MLTIREHCDACGGSLEDVFSMGSMPLANGLLSEAERRQPCETFPLMVAECQSCSLAQLRFVVDPARLYAGYPFFTGASGPNMPYFADLARWIASRSHGKRVLEIGSNDGTLLAAMEDVGLNVTGVDPASEQCQRARERLQHGEVVCDYWGTATAYDFKGLFDTVVACNVLGHSADLQDFISGVRRVIRTDGLLVIEVQYLTALLQQAAFELIYHEHVSYFDEVSLGGLLARNGFKVLGWEVTNSQCGTLRMWASAMGGGLVPGPQQHDWRGFAHGTTERRAVVLQQIDSLQREGRRVCFYGAPAKATQLSNYWRLGTNSIAFATDTTPTKQGRYIPGSLIPVVPPSHLEPTDAAIVAAWNFYPQIISHEATFIAAGGLLINPADIGDHFENSRADDSVRSVA